MIESNAIFKKCKQNNHVSEPPSKNAYVIPEQEFVHIYVSYKEFKFTSPWAKVIAQRCAQNVYDLKMRMTKIQINSNMFCVISS